MTEVVIDYDAIAEAAAEGEDQTQMKGGGGGFERPVPAEGRCTVRLQQYIEFGKQPSNNPKYKPAYQVMLRFELNSPKHLIELDDGTKIPNQVTIRLPKGGKDSKYGRLFTALNYNGKYRHFAQMVGKGSWLAEVTHNVTNPGTDKEKTYANLDKNKAWTFTAPVFENPATGEVTPVPVPELHDDPTVFLFENSGLGDGDYLKLWDAIFIEGEHEDGQRKGESKNWIQDLITSSLTFPESRLKRLLDGHSTQDLEDIPFDADETAPAAEEPAKATKAKPATKKPEPEPEVIEDDVDPLVAAGLL